MNLFQFCVVLQAFKFSSSLSLFKTCYGGEAKTLPMGCETVVGFPLIIQGFTYDIEPNTEIGLKLGSIKRINEGIIIRDNKFSHFDALKKLQYIGMHGISGPSIQLENNYKLISLKFADLRILNGTMPLVSFWNDNFPHYMKSNNRAFQEFLDILATAYQSMDSDLCYSDSFALHTMQIDSNKIYWHFLVAGSVLALASTIIIDVIWYKCFQYRLEKELDKMALEKEKIELKKLLDKAQLDEQWRLECIEIACEEKKWMDSLRSRTKDNPYYAPGELQKWAEEEEIAKRKLRELRTKDKINGAKPAEKFEKPNKQKASMKPEAAGGILKIEKVGKAKKKESKAGEKNALKREKSIKKVEFKVDTISDGLSPSRTGPEVNEIGNVENERHENATKAAQAAEDSTQSFEEELVEKTKNEENLPQKENDPKLKND